MQHLKQGATLQGGKYKIVKVLGQGSFGITYLATTKVALTGGLGNMEVTVNVAIKEFFMEELSSRAADGTSVERTSSALVKNYLYKFRREAENLSKLHHPNIVRVLEVIDENNTTYYVMEFINGETIDDYIKKNGRLPEKKSFRVTQEVCNALAYMHEHKMLHLDLKPKNIMRDSEGHIYLIDFGLAKQYNESGEPESSTTLGLGTPGYAPIEQAHYKNDGSFPVTLDIYAVGASLYKMLTGKTPPESSFVLNEGLPLSDMRQAGLSPATIDIVSKAMAPIKKERYQTVGLLLKAISSAMFNGEHIDDSVESDVDDFAFGNNDNSQTADFQDELKESVHVDNSEATVFYVSSDVSSKSNEHEYVDLGLPSGLKWATCNLGASRPEDFGDYYAWGEIETKKHFSEYTYKYCKAGLFSTKYVDLGGDISGDGRYDAAVANWGHGWRLPRKSEIEELIKHCYWHFTFKGDVCGFLITGPNGNCIFLPASGWFHGSLIYKQDAFGFYMSSSSLESGASRIYHGCFRSDKQNVSLQYRYYGFSVRPVID